MEQHLTPADLEKANKVIDRLMRCKQEVHINTVKIPIEAKLLKQYEKDLIEVQASVISLKKSLADRHKRLEYAQNYVAEHSDDEDKVKEMEALAIKINKMKAKLAALRAEVK